MARSPLSRDTLLKMNDRSESSSMDRREVSSVLVCLQPHPVISTSCSSSKSPSQLRKHRLRSEQACPMWAALGLRAALGAPVKELHALHEERPEQLHADQAQHLRGVHTSASMHAGLQGWLHWKNCLPEGSLGLPMRCVLMYGPCDVAYLLASDADVLDVDTRQQGLDSV